MADEYIGNASDQYMWARRFPDANKRYGYEMLSKSRANNGKFEIRKGKRMHCVVRKAE